MEAGFQVISRLRDDANLEYFFIGKQKSSKGRPKKYDGKMDFKNLNLKHANLVSEKDREKIYSLKAHSKSKYFNILANNLALQNKAL